MELLSYKGYNGSIEASLTDNVLHGKILFVNDLVTYEADNIPQLKAEFEAAVNDYLETCAQIGKVPQKSCSGQFNVRVTPELHGLAHQRAAEEGTSLNAVTASALRNYLKPPAQQVREEPEAPYTTSTNFVNVFSYFYDDSSKIDPNEKVHGTINSAIGTVNFVQSNNQIYDH